VSRLVGDEVHGAGKLPDSVPGEGGQAVGRGGSGRRGGGGAAVPHGPTFAVHVAGRRRSPNADHAVHPDARHAGVRRLVVDDGTLWKKASRIGERLAGHTDIDAANIGFFTLSTV